MSPSGGRSEPTSKVIASSGRVGRESSDSSVVGDGSGGRTRSVSSVWVESDGVVINVPYGVESRIGCSHGVGGLVGVSNGSSSGGRPTGESVAGFYEGIGGEIRLGVESDGLRTHGSGSRRVSVEGDGVVVRSTGVGSTIPGVVGVTDGSIGHFGGIGRNLFGITSPDSGEGLGSVGDWDWCGGESTRL